MSLERFIKAQEATYQTALQEIKQGRKQSHWMWYIFPQIAGLGLSDMSQRYAIKDLKEANEYLAHPILGARLIEISNVLVGLESKSANQVFGKPDDMKLKSCMTLFNEVPDANGIFKKVLDKFFDGRKDEKSLFVISRKDAK